MTLTMDRPVRAATTWHVESLTRTGGVVRSWEDGDCLRLTVADAVAGADSDAATHIGLAAPDLGDAAPQAAGDGTHVWLHANGRLVVRTSASPPLLVVTASGSRLLPSAPATEGETQLAAGDIALICSSSALDHLPKGLGGVLAYSPLRLGAHDPQGLLRELMDDSEFGAAVVARCRRAFDHSVRDYRPAHDPEAHRNPTKEDQP